MASHCRSVCAMIHSHETTNKWLLFSCSFLSRVHYSSMLCLFKAHSKINRLRFEDKSCELLKLILLPSGVPGKERQTHHKWQVVGFLLSIFFPDYHDNMLFLAHKLPSFICLPCLQSQDIVSIKITSLCQIFVKKSLSSLVYGPVFVVSERLSPANENSYSSMSKCWNCLSLTSWK